MNLPGKSAALTALALTIFGFNASLASELTVVDGNGSTTTGRIVDPKIVEIGLFLSNSSAFCVITNGMANQQSVDLVTLAEQITQDVVDVKCSYGKPFEVTYKGIQKK